MTAMKQLHLPLLHIVTSVTVLVASPRGTSYTSQECEVFIALIASILSYSDHILSGMMSRKHKLVNMFLIAICHLTVITDMEFVEVDTLCQFVMELTMRDPGVLILIAVALVDCPSKKLRVKAVCRLRTRNNKQSFQQRDLSSHRTKVPAVQECSSYTESCSYSLMNSFIDLLGRNATHMLWDNVEHCARDTRKGIRLSQTPKGVCAYDVSFVHAYVRSFYLDNQIGGVVTCFVQDISIRSNDRSRLLFSIYGDLFRKEYFLMQIDIKFSLSRVHQFACGREDLTSFLSFSKAVSRIFKSFWYGCKVLSIRLSAAPKSSVISKTMIYGPMEPSETVEIQVPTCS
jgi:hypothetical protein